MDVIVAGYQIKQRNADFKILDDSLSEEEYGIGFKKGNTELKEAIDSVLTKMTKDDFSAMMDEAISVQPLAN
jgi:polar amino acid transport system substrate-binding protein